MSTLFRKGLHVASAAALVVACGGGDKNQQARAPTTDTTATTGAEMQPQEQQMQQPQGYTYDQSMTSPDQTGGTGSMGQGATSPGQGDTSGSTAVEQGTMGAGGGTTDTQGTMGQGAMTGADTSTTDTSKAKAERALNDSEIFAVETAANEGEIQMAELARKSARSQQVKNFAQMMITDHRNAQNRAKQIAQKAKITATDNEVSNQLKSDVQSMMSDLKGQKGSDFDRMYIDDQVKAHRSVLEAVDNRLMPNVSNSDMKTHLTEFRSTISNHLTKAEDIQSKLQQQPVGATGAKSGGSKAKDTTTTKGKSTDESKPKSDDTPKGGLGGGTKY